jgi:hypothetical protein
MRYCLMLMHFWINYNRIFIESIARNDVKVIKSKKLYDGIGEKMITMLDLMIADSLISVQKDRYK